MFRKSLVSKAPWIGSLPVLFILLLYTGSPLQGMPFDSNSSEEGEDSAIVEIRTEYGTMKVYLYDETPKHRDNFLKLAEKGFFDSTSFHRVIEGFMIQGGDPYTKQKDPEGKIGNGGPGYRIDSEIRDGLFHKKGALGAARKGDRQNPERRSNGSQFYIVQGKRFSREDLGKMEERRSKGDKNFSFSQDQIQAYTEQGGAPHLDGKYTVFGEVIEGMEVIDKIAAVDTDPKKNRPKEAVRMNVELIQRP